MTPESETSNSNFENTDNGLPGVDSLISQGWQYAENNLALVGILSVPFLAVDILTYLAAVSAGSVADSSGNILLWTSLVALVGYVLLLATALYLVTHQTQAPRFADGFAWAWRHFWSVLWLSILTGFVVLGGFSLLIVPGIIVATYIALSQIVLATEGSKGLTALLRSRELVYGNWLAIFWRLVVVQLVYFVVIVLIGVIVGVAASFFADELLSEFIFNMLFSVVGSAGTLIFLSITYQLYTALKAARAAVPLDEVSSAATKYQALGWFGLASLIFAVILVGAFAVMSNELLDTQGVRTADTVLATELKLVQFQADQYYANQVEPSYSGVCNKVQSLISVEREVACSESADAYALSVLKGETLHCVDSTGYDKIIYTGLGEQTRCLEV
jgi:hypothetical protein